MDPLGTWDTNESAETRMQRRLEREEQRKRARKRIEVGILLVGVVFVASIGVGYATAFAKKQGRTPTRSPRVTSPAAVVGTTVAQAEIASETAGGETNPKAEPLASLTPTPEPSPEPAPKPKPKATTPKPKTSSSPQRLRIGIGTTGYDPERLTADASRPIVLTVGRGEGCAAGFNMPQLDVHKDNSKGDVTFSLGRVDPGRYYYTCDMGMVSGTLVVK